MRKKLIFVFLLLAVISICATSLFVEASGSVQKGKTMYVRSNFTYKRSNIYWHNPSRLPYRIPVGSEVVIKEVGRKVVNFVTVSDGKKFRLVVPARCFDKYFVDTKEEIGLDQMSPDVRQKVLNMQISEGMTKEEVFASRGNPSFIAYGVKSWDHPLDRVMSSNTWYYNASSSSIENLVKFENGVAVNIGPFQR